MSDISDLTKLILKFRDERNWKQFHTYKDMVISMVLETAEFAEHFQWRTEAELAKYLEDSKNKQHVADELADVLYWVLIASHDLDIDIRKEFIRKMKKNAKKYPVAKFKSADKKKII